MLPRIDTTKLIPATIADGKTYADKRRMLYKKRHEKYRKIPDTNAYYADKLLW